MFQLLTVTETELTAFVGRTQKSGPDDVPAVSFRLRLAGVENVMLDLFSKTLRPAIYMAVPGQDDLPGMESSTPLLRSKDVAHLAPDFRYEGWKVSVARGMNDDALQMQQCKVDDFKFDFHEGGRMDFDFRVSTADVDEEGAGMLWGRQKRKVFARIEAPELPPAADMPPIDGTAKAFEADYREAGDIFAQQVGEPGPDDESDQAGGDSEGDAPDAGNAEPQRGENWPFGTRGETEPSFAETAGATGGTPEGDAEQREIEAGMAASIAKAGKSKARGKRGGARA